MDIFTVHIFASTQIYTGQNNKDLGLSYSNKTVQNN